MKNNKAVVDYSEDWAGAVPQEYVDDWTSLYGWEDQMSEEQRRRELERLMRQQEQLSQEVAQLARQMSSSVSDVSSDCYS